MDKENDFKKQVINHLKEKGFNCAIQLRFPHLIAWKPFVNEHGESLALNVQATIGGKAKNKVIFPFFVFMVECKNKKKLSKKDHVTVKKILKEGRCNSFLVAYPGKKELKFQEHKEH